MATLRFSFGTMGSGKSTLALQIHHNLHKRGLQGILCSQLDRADGRVSSALGVSADAIEVGPRLDLFEMALAGASRRGRIDYLVCDEAQFYLPAQIDQLARIVDDLGADVFGQVWSVATVGGLGGGCGDREAAGDVFERVTAAVAAGRCTRIDGEVPDLHAGDPVSPENPALVDAATTDASARKDSDNAP